MPKDTKGYCTKFFSALANKLRISILQSLLHKEKTVTQLTNDLRRERTLISHNLADLLAVDLIRFKKHKQERIYYPNEKILPQLFFMMQNFMCKTCSLRSTCKLLKRRGIEKIPLSPSFLTPCQGCR